MAAEPRTAVVPLRPAEPQPLAVAPFAEWTYDDAAEAVAARLPENYAERRDFANGKHLDPGGDGKGLAGFVGPQPADGHPDGAAKREKIRSQFAPWDVVGEALQAVADAFDREAQIGLSPIDAPEDGAEVPDEVQRRINEGQRLLTVLWDAVRLHEHVKSAIRTACYAEHAALRWWIPPGRALRLVREDGREVTFLPRAASLETAAGWLALSAPDPAAGALVTDEATQENAAVVLDTVDEDGDKLERAQIAYLDGATMVLRTAYKAGQREANVETYQTGGRLPMAGLEARNLLTDPVLRTQKQLNFQSTLLTRLGEGAGFRGRTLGNTEPFGPRRLLKPDEEPRPGTYLWLDGDGNRIEITPEARTMGHDMTTELVGLSSVDKDGRRTYATPVIHIEDPVDPTPFIRAAEHQRAKILHMLRQAHRAGESGAEASGYAYEQARAAFLKLLLNLKGGAEGMLRDLLTAGLALVEALAGKPGYFTAGLRVTVDLWVDAGPPSPEQQRQDREAWKDGAMSWETLAARLGIEDAEGEWERLQASPFFRLRLLKEVAETVGAIADRLSAEGALRLLVLRGVLAEDEADALLPRDTDGVEVA